MFLWALLFSVLLFFANLFFGKLFYKSFKANILHYAVCVIVALITCICLTIIFKINRAITKTEKLQAIVKLQSSDTLNVQQSDVFDTQKLLSALQQENGMIAKFLSAVPATSSLDSQKYVNAIGNEVKNKLKSYRNKVIVVLTIFQFIAFIFVGVSASKSGKGFAVAPYSDDSSYY